MPHRNAGRISDRPGIRRDRYANEAELDRADAGLVETQGGGSRRDPEDVRRGTPEDEDAPRRDASAKPRGNITRRVGPGDGHENLDGLDETEDAVRREAERPVGERREGHRRRRERGVDRGR